MEREKSVTFDASQSIYTCVWEREDTVSERWPPMTFTVCASNDTWCVIWKTNVKFIQSYDGRQLTFCSLTRCSPSLTVSLAEGSGSRRASALVYRYFCFSSLPLHWCFCDEREREEWTREKRKKKRVKRSRVELLQWVSCLWYTDWLSLSHINY